MSDNLPHENEEEARRRYDEPETPDNKKISMTRMYKSIIAKALEEQKVLADETSMQVAKVAFTEGVKQSSERQEHPNHRSSVEMESACPTQGSVMTNSDFGLQQIHQLRPETSPVTVPFMVNNAVPAQMAANIPAYSTSCGMMNSNKTLPTAVSFDTGNRYKRETNFKFSEGTVDQYESFRSQFNIHHKMLD